MEPRNATPSGGAAANANALGGGGGGTGLDEAGETAAGVCCGCAGHARCVPVDGFGTGTCRSRAIQADRFPSSTFVFWFGWDGEDFFGVTGPCIGLAYLWAQALKAEAFAGLGMAGCSCLQATWYARGGGVCPGEAFGTTLTEGILYDGDDAAGETDLGCSQVIFYVPGYTAQYT